MEEQLGTKRKHEATKSLIVRRHFEVAFSDHHRPVEIERSGSVLNQACCDFNSTVRKGERNNIRKKSVWSFVGNELRWSQLATRDKESRTQCFTYAEIWHFTF